MLTKSQSGFAEELWIIANYGNEFEVRLSKCEKKSAI